MCLNPMCAQFGAFFGPEDLPGSPARRYEVIQGKSVRLRCRGCGQSGGLHAQASLRAVARHFLSESFPFADCANEECPNHGCNAFEHFGQRTGSGRARYRQHDQHRLICNACTQAGRKPASFAIGVSSGLSGDKRKVRRDVRWIIASVREHLPVTTVRGLFGIRVGNYYRRLFRIAPRIGDYLAYRNASLLSSEVCRKHRGTVQVYTDVLNVSLHQVGDVARVKQLKVIVSVVGLEKTHFVLAAHPYFLPESKEPEMEELERDSDDPNFLNRRWDALETVFSDVPMFVDGELADDVPSEGHAGYFLRSPYAEVAHFLTVEKMLSGFARRHYYMDGASELFQSALVAMRQQVLDKSVEIALFQFEKKGESRATGEGRKKKAEPAADGTGSKQKTESRAGVRSRGSVKAEYVGRKSASEATLRAAWKDMESRFDGKLRAGELPLGGEAETSYRAGVWKRAFRGGFSRPGGWAWLRFPVNLQQYPECRTLWLTRRPRDSIDEGVPLLLHATLQPVDSAFGSIRRRTSAARRPWKGATGLSFLEHAYSPPIVCAEMTMYLFHRNYHRRPWGPKGQPIPARHMGLIRSKAKPRSPVKGRPLPPVKAMWSFRLEVEHAREITKWLKMRRRT